MKSALLNIQNRLNILSPGLIVVGTIAAAAGFLSLHYKAPVMLFALLIGIAFNFLSSDERCAPGIEFSSKKILRFGVALLGFRVTLDHNFRAWNKRSFVCSYSSSLIYWRQLAYCKVDGKTTSVCHF